MVSITRRGNVARTRFGALAMASLVCTPHAACEITLSGVPIMDSPAPDEGTGDGGMEQAGASLPFSDDFDRSDGSLSKPWQVAGQGQAEIWDGRLCLSKGMSAELPLEPAAVAYMRVDVPSSSGLQVEARDAGGALFSVVFEERAVTLDGATIVGHRAFDIVKLEAELRYERQEVLLSAGSEGSVAAPFSGQGAHHQVHALRFTAGPGTNGAVCIDNVHVGLLRPSDNPFQRSPRVNACVPDARLESRCVARACCDAIVHAQNDVCPRTCDASGDCTCDNSRLVACAAECLEKHPSGGFAQCTFACRRGLDSELTTELVSCIDAQCADGPSELAVDLGPVTWPDDPAPQPRKHLELRGGESDGDEELSLELHDFDAGESRGLGTLFAVRGEKVELYADPSHSRVVALASIAAENQPPTRVMVWEGQSFRELLFPRPVVEAVPSPSRRYLWVYTRSPRYNDVPLEQPPPGTAYLLTYDGRVIHRRDASEWLPVPPVYSPDESQALLFYAGSDGHDYVLLNLARGHEHTYSVPARLDQEWQALWPYQRGVVWLREAELIRTEFGKELAPIKLLEGVSLRHGSLIMDAHRVYARGPDGPVLLAALASNGAPEAASPTRVLNSTVGGLSLSDADGRTLATHVTRPNPTGDREEEQEPHIAVTRVYPYGPGFGLFVTYNYLIEPSDQQDVYAFKVVDDAFSISHVVTVPPDGYSGPRELTVMGHGESSTFTVSADRLLLVDAVTGESLTIAGPRPPLHHCDGYSCLAEYGMPARARLLP